MVRGAAAAGPFGREGGQPRANQVRVGHQRPAHSQVHRERTAPLEAEIKDLRSQISQLRGEMAEKDRTAGEATEQLRAQLKARNGCASRDGEGSRGRQGCETDPHGEGRVGRRGEG